MPTEQGVYQSADQYGYGRAITDAELTAWVGNDTAWAWKHEYREDAEDRFCRVPLWQPFLQDKLEAHFGIVPLTPTETPSNG